MKRMLFLLLPIACLAIMGCPLQTETPIVGDTNVRVPTWMFGKWTQLKDDKETGTSYQLKADPASNSKLIIIPIDAEGQPVKGDTRPAVVSQVNGQLYISVYEKGDETSEVGYYHYAVGRNGSSGDMQLVPLREHIVSYTATGKELAAFLASEKDSDTYLDKAAIERYRKRK